MRLDPEAAGRLAVGAAEHWIAAGDHARARRLLLDCRDTVDGPVHARILSFLAWSPDEDATLAEAVADAHDALGRLDGDVVAEAHIRLNIAFNEVARGRFAAAEDQARAVTALSDADSQAVAQAALAELTALRTGAAGDIPRTTLVWGRGPVQGRSMLIAATALLHANDLDAARPRLERAYALAVRAGHEPRLANAAAQLAEVERRGGDWQRARELAAEARELAAQGMRRPGLTAALVPSAVLAAAAGDADGAHAAARQGLELARRLGDELSAIQHQGALGLLELTLGNPTAALEWLRPAAETTLALSIAPSAHQILGDACQAATAIGDVDWAQPVVAYLEAHAEGGDGWTLGAALRSRALLHAHAGEREAARDGFAAAVEAHERAGQPFALARSLILLGAAERRLRRKRPSHDALDRADELLAALPAPGWRERVVGDRSRLRNQGSESELSTTEARIAELAAAGLSNPEIAAEVFVSRKTVEANLSRIYRKLDVRSRVELSRKLSG